MNKDKIELSIIVANTPIKEYGEKGLTYVEGKLDTEYALRVRNSYSHRVLVIPSIDGLNPLNGRNTQDNYEGYVVPAYGSITIDGWRTSLSQVNKFVFNKKDNSYSAKTGNGDANCGVVGIRVYGEKLPEVQYCPVYYSQPYYVYRDTPWVTYWNTPMCGGLSNPGNNNFNSILQHGQAIQCSTSSYTSSVNNFSSCSAKESTGNTNQSYFSQVVDDTPHQVGTGWGSEKDSVVSQTTFTKGELLQTLEIFYADHRGLESLGIDLNKSSKVAFSRPVAFGGFCTPPKN